MPSRLFVPLLLCAGMLIVPLVALSNGGPSSRGASVRVAAGAPVAPAPQPAAVDGPAVTTAPVVYGPPSAPVTEDRQAPAPTVTIASAAPATSAAPVTTRAPQARIASVATTPPAQVTSTTRPPTTAAPVPPPPRHSESGQASWYDAPAGTCAHQTLPFGTVLSIRDTANGQTATCTVEDRGPYVAGRIVDLAPDVFNKLSSTDSGVITVVISWS